MYYQRLIDEVIALKMKTSGAVFVAPINLLRP